MNFNYESVFSDKTNSMSASSSQHFKSYQSDMKMGSPENRALKVEDLKDRKKDIGDKSLKSELVKQKEENEALAK